MTGGDLFFSTAMVGRAEDHSTFCAVVIGGGSSVWDENAPWHSIAVRCLQKHLGASRRAGSGTYAVTKKHGDYLVPAGFRLPLRRSNTRTMKPRYSLPIAVSPNATYRPARRQFRCSIVLDTVLS